MKKNLWIQLFSVLVFTLSLCFIALPAQADMGPKPSTQITFTNLADDQYYVTLLAKEEGTDIIKFIPGKSKALSPVNVAEIDVAFAAYQDGDGFFYTGNQQSLHEKAKFIWGKYPPTIFKILLYHPQSKTYLVSPAYKRYAFDSYYTVDMATAKATAPHITASETYDLTTETGSLLIRTALTILVEILIALAFGLREKRQLSLLIKVNLVTQLLLNACLHITNYYLGALVYFVFYILLEIAVMLLEALIYFFCLNRVSTHQRNRLIYVAYAVIANALSFFAGIILSAALPGIF